MSLCCQSILTVKCHSDGNVEFHARVQKYSSGGGGPRIEIMLSYSYSMGCPPVRGDNPRALASGLSYVQVDKYGITILYHLHQCRPCTS